MLTGRRTLLVAAGLAVLVGLAALLFARREEPVTAGRAPSAGESVRETQALSGDALESEGRTVPDAGQPATVETSDAVAARRASGTGRVEGSVLELDGTPRPGCTVILIETGSLAERGWYAAERRSGRSAEDGRYAIDAVPAGPWEVCLQPPLADVPVDQPCVRRVGSLVVVANAATPFDVVLPGARTLSGNVLMVEEDAEGPGQVMLFLEVAHATPPGRVVASAVTVATPDAEGSGSAFPATSAELDRETRELLLDLVHGSERRLEELLADEDQLLELLRDRGPELVRPPERRPPRGGNFRFDGLEAGRYVLRLSNSPRGRLCVEREVDLTLGDVELPAERITLGDFVSTAVERDR